MSTQHGSWNNVYLYVKRALWSLHRKPDVRGSLRDITTKDAEIIVPQYVYLVRTDDTRDGRHSAYRASRMLFVSCDSAYWHDTH